MTRTVLPVAAGLFVVVTTAILHFNHTEYALQLECMHLRGNWETREGSRQDGCRFPATTKELSK